MELVLITLDLDKNKSRSGYIAIRGVLLIKYKDEK